MINYCNLVRKHTHFVKAILVTTFIEINHSPDYGTNLGHQNVRTKCVKAGHRGFTVLGPDLLKVCVYKSIYKLISDAKKRTNGLLTVRNKGCVIWRCKIVRLHPVRILLQ